MCSYEVMRNTNNIDNTAFIILINYINYGKIMLLLKHLNNQYLYLTMHDSETNHQTVKGQMSRFLK